MYSNFSSVVYAALETKWLYSTLHRKWIHKLLPKQFFWQKDKDESFDPIVRAAHVIKSSASDLMCEQLRSTAMALETASQTAADTDGGKKNKPMLVCIQNKLDELKEAVANYHKKLEEIVEEYG